MAITRKEHNGTLLTNVLQTLLTYSAGLISGGAVLLNVELTTNGGTARTVEVYLIPSGQTAAPQYLIYRGPTVANDSIAVPGGPFWAGPGAFVQAKQDAGSDVIARLTAFEEA